MPVSVSYVARETGGNLRRNLLMTLAAVLTMAVSLGALGVVLINRQAVSKATLQWRGGVQVAIFMQPAASNNQIVAVSRELGAMPGIKKFYFVDKPHAYAEFRQIFAGQPDLLQALDANAMPTSYRVVPIRAQDASQLAKQFQGQPGVRTVTYAQQEIAKLVRTSQQLRTGAEVIAAVVMIGAVALIINTIQLAIFARRREVAVMKLVGATNWFIRVPFMVEGLVHGLVGAIAASVFTYLLRDTIASFFSTASPFSISKIVISSHEALYTDAVVLVVGALVGALGSALAVRRFLAV